MKYMKEFAEHFSGKPVFSISDVKRHFSHKKLSGKYLHTFIHNLRESGKITRITRGIYTFKTDPNAAIFAFSPAYFGLQDALSLKNLWEQETNPVIITTRKIRPGTRTILGAKIIVRRISKKMFFGQETIKSGDMWLQVSDTEKTLIDFAYFNEPLGKETLKNMRKKINTKKLNAYLKRVSERTQKKVRKL